jgi:hypothetical protein
MNITFIAENASLRQQVCKLKQLDEVGRRFSILSHHLESLMQSVDLLAPPYSATMKPFDILAASMGETLYELLIASSAFHREDKSNDIATVSVKCWDCTKTSFLCPWRTFVLSRGDTCQIHHTPSLPGNRCRLS